MWHYTVKKKNLVEIQNISINQAQQVQILSVFPPKKSAEVGSGVLIAVASSPAKELSGTESLLFFYLIIVEVISRWLVSLHLSNAS